MLNTRQLKAKNWKGHCVVCGKDFTYADGWECDAQPGHHVLDPKLYFHLGGGHIQSLRDRRMFTPTLNLASDLEVRDKMTGEITRLEGCIVHFREGGKYDTSDPVEQYHLDMHPHVRSGPEGQEAWDKIYLTPEQQLSKAQGQLIDVQRQIRESNSLLDLTKQAKRERDGASVR